MSAEYQIVIPARMASQRLPGKPLLSIAGRSLLEHVYRQACKSGAGGVVIATDDRKIRDAAAAFGAEALMTSQSHQSGSDRIAECADQLGWTDEQLIVNLQGDEPLISTEVLEKVCTAFNDPQVQMATPVTKIKTVEDLSDPNLVRVVLDREGNALYFTRAIIPFFRDLEKYNDWLNQHDYYKHIGIYAYRKDFLLHLTNLEPGKLENVEKLEQLRVLENGFKIRAVITDYQSRSVDTKEDLIEMNNFITDHHLTMDEFDAKM